MSAEDAVDAVDTVDAELTGRRVEEVLDRLTAGGDSEVCAAAEELVHLLVDFYGAGLARIVGLLETVGTVGTVGTGPDIGLMAALLEDPLVSSLLVLHDLHPEDTGTRISRALDAMRGRPVESAGFDAATGTLRVRPTGGGCGCPSTAAATRQAVEDALACLAPEVITVELEQVDGPREPALLQIGTRPPDAAHARTRAEAASR
jgi:Fe-S cluster biogenesis protein NfuA